MTDRAEGDSEMRVESVDAGRLDERDRCIIRTIESFVRGGENPSP